MLTSAMLTVSPGLMPLARSVAANRVASSSSWPRVVCGPSPAKGKWMLNDDVSMSADAKKRSQMYHWR